MFVSAALPIVLCMGTTLFVNHFNNYYDVFFRPRLRRLNFRNETPTCVYSKLGLIDPAFKRDGRVLGARDIYGIKITSVFSG